MQSGLLRNAKEMRYDAVMRIATLNVQNMRLRQTPHGPHLDGAIDRDVAQAEDRCLDVRDRQLTAAVVAKIDADIVCLQEVFDQATLDFFHDEFLAATGTNPYPYRICLPGNDGHGLDVAVMARRKADRIRSHATARAADLGIDDPDDLLHDAPVFRRDCLEVWFGDLALFICHLKAPYPDRNRSLAIRSLEIQAIRHVIEGAIPDPSAGFWMILGDVNTPVGLEPDADGDLAQLLDGFAVDLMRRVPEGADWTFRMPDTGEALRPDAMLASPALAQIASTAVPEIERSGMDPATAQKAGFPFTLVQHTRPHASDHAALWIDLPDALWSQSRPER